MIIIMPYFFRIQGYQHLKIVNLGGFLCQQWYVLVKWRYKKKKNELKLFIVLNLNALNIKLYWSIIDEVVYLLNMFNYFIFL